jgi:hypothetical protein
MILISHRGNLNGKIESLENNPEYINQALKTGLDVELDVWSVEGEWFLGHDKPDFKINLEYLYNDRLWCHAKNIEAVEKLSACKNIHWFWHQNDVVTLTSEGYIWAYPGSQPIKNSIAVMPEKYDDDLSLCIGVCSDYIRLYG